MKKILLLLMFFTLAIYAKKNPYTTEGTDEYENVTRHIEGTWKVVEASGFLPNGQLGTKFTEGEIEFMTPPKRRVMEPIAFASN